MNKYFYPGYNLEHSLLGGQSFAWDKIGGTFYGFVKDGVVEIKQSGDYLLWQTFPRKDNWELVSEYFRLDLNVHEIQAEIDKDKYTNQAVQKFKGLGILKQDFEEALLSYLISPTNSIKSIRYRIRNMNRLLGEKLVVNGIDFYLFPKTEIVANTDLNVLLNAKLGFHAKFVKNAAKEIVENGLTSAVETVVQKSSSENVSYETKKILTSIAGVGEKVADCVMLYSLAVDNAFPLDVWGKRIATDYYGLDPKMKYEEMSKWTRDYFGKYAGWAGQYLFEYIRLSAKY